MSDEPEVTSLHFTRFEALCVDAWPPLIPVTEEFLRQAYLYGAKVEGDELRFAIGNGEATYKIHRDRPHGRGFVATLVEGNTPANLKSRKQKFEPKAE